MRGNRLKSLFFLRGRGNHACGAFRLLSWTNMRGFGRVGAAAALLLAVGDAAWADDLEVDALVVAVTVFPDRAEVTRMAEVDLPAGEHRVNLINLPAALHDQSIRVEGEGSAPLTLGAVQVSRKYQDEEVRSAAEREFEARLEALQDQRRSIDDRIAAYQAQQKFIAGIGADYPKATTETIRAGDMRPQIWPEAWGRIGSGMGDVLKKIQDAEIERRELVKRIYKAQSDYDSARRGSPRRAEAEVTVEAARAGKARLRVSYQISGASWRPVYEARLDSAKKQVKLVQKGEVRQLTGEDWTGARLTLSTARPAVGAAMPELSAWFVDAVRPEPLEARISHAEAPAEMAGEEEAEMMDGGPVPEPEPEPMLESAGYAAAAVVATDFVALYRIVGKVDVPADGTAKTFPVSERTMDSQFAVYAAPKLSLNAYLYGEQTYKGEDPLPAGAALIFRDGAYIGADAMPQVRPGETFKLSFGVDDRVEVNYRKLTDKRSTEGLLGGEERITLEYRIEVVNRHAEPFKVTVEDQLPVPQDERIKVDLARGATPPTDRDREDRKGVLTWESEMKPGETRTIDFGYYVQYPEKMSLSGL